MLQKTMRWYGPQDGVSLQDIAQAGCTGVVTALHHIPVGEIWTDQEIKKRKHEVEAAGMVWQVVESLPVHEDIKRRNGNFQRWIDNYKISLQNLGENGIQVVTYNFMPVLDWLRTDLHYPTKTGTALRFKWDAFRAFDLFILKRPGVEKDYTTEQTEAARAYFEKLSEENKARLASSCMQGLPGSKEAFSRENILALLKEFEGIDEKTLQSHLFQFLNEISPALEKSGVKMAIHPDDPPFPVLGLPRIMSHADHIRALLENTTSQHVGLCFCTGSFGARKENDLPKMFKEFGSRIYFLHLRSTARDQGGNFFEADHLAGDANLYTIIKLATELQHVENRSIPMRPDHGHQLQIDAAIDSFPGYSFVGRMKGLAEICGMEHAVYQERAEKGL